MSSFVIATPNGFDRHTGLPLILTEKFRACSIDRSRISNVLTVTHDGWSYERLDMMEEPRHTITELKD